MGMRVEYRKAPEIRVSGRRLEGYAATFGTRTQIGNTTEEIAPGAFARSLATNPDILALLDHNREHVLGRTRSGTLSLAEDNTGLAYAIELPDTRAANDALALAQRGDLGGMSFGFLVPDGGDTWDGTHRTLNHVDLMEVSVVQSWPAYPNTTVNVRGSAGIANFKRWLEVQELWVS